MIRRIGLLYLLLLPVLCFAQPGRPDTVWTRTYGDTLNDWGMDVQQSSDGGFVVLVRGDSQSNPGRVVKLTEDGVTEWEHITRFGLYDIITYGIIAMPDMSYIYTGLDNSYGTVTVKLNAAGQPVWSMYQPGTISIYYRFITRCLDGGCAVFTANMNNSGATFLRYTDDGELLWSRWFGITDSGPTPVAFTQTTDGGYDVLMMAYHDPSVFRISSFGDSMWTRSIVVGTDASAANLCPTADGGVAVCGARVVQQQPALYGGYIAQLDAEAAVRWVRECGRAPCPWLYSISQSADGGFYTAGEVVLTGHQQDFYVARLNAAGDTLWSWTYGGPARDNAFAVKAVEGGGCVTAGIRTLNDRGNDAFVVRMHPDQSNGVTVHATASAFTLAQNYPNPFNATTEIAFDLPRTIHATLKVFDIVGREVSTLVNENLQAGEHRISFDGALLPSGVYFYQLRATGFTQTKKMLLLK